MDSKIGWGTFFYLIKYCFFFRRDDFGEELEMNSRTVFYPDSQLTDQSIILHSNKIKNATPPEKILICAPSNAAIDEIVRKILEKGTIFNLSVHIFILLI